jgi:hypothetical protein
MKLNFIAIADLRYAMIAVRRQNRILASVFNQERFIVWIKKAINQVKVPPWSSNQLPDDKLKRFIGARHDHSAGRIDSSSAP